jgi:hypothetical protein
MNNKQTDNERRLEAIMNSLAESIVETSDEEIIAEVAEGGKGANAFASQVQQAMLRSAKTYLQENLRNSRTRYEQDVAALKAKEYSLPNTPAERRRLLAMVFQLRPEFVTAQWREFDSLTDEDIESSLRQMQELGILDDIERDANK